MHSTRAVHSASFVQAWNCEQHLAVAHVPHAFLGGGTPWHEAPDAPDDEPPPDDEAAPEDDVPFGGVGPPDEGPLPRFLKTSPGPPP
jgi:hypothetical protein